MASAADIQKELYSTTPSLAKVKRLLDEGARANATPDGQPLLHTVAIRLWNFRREDKAKGATMRQIKTLLREAGAPLDIFSAAILGDRDATAALLEKEPALALRRFPPNNYPLIDMVGYCGEAGPEIIALLKKAKRAAPRFDWDAAERDLHAAAVDALGRLAKKHKAVTFSAFAFDCDSGNGSLIIKLNAASNVIDSKYNPVGNYSHGAELDADPRVRDVLVEAKEGSSNGKRFMDCVARVTLRLSREGAFAVLDTTPDFNLLVADHDEPLNEARRRLKRAAASERTPKEKPPPKARPDAKQPPEAKAAAKGVRLENTEDGSRKFWAIEVEGAAHTVHFGRIGTPGQTKTKTFASAAEAAKDADTLVSQKRKKGYR